MQFGYEKLLIILEIGQAGVFLFVWPIENDTVVVHVNFNKFLNICVQNVDVLF